MTENQHSGWHRHLQTINRRDSTELSRTGVIKDLIRLTPFNRQLEKDLCYAISLLGCRNSFSNNTPEPLKNSLARCIERIEVGIDVIVRCWHGCSSPFLPMTEEWSISAPHFSRTTCHISESHPASRVAFCFPKRVIFASDRSMVSKRCASVNTLSGNRCARWPRRK
jgi:hypothetical protein